MPAPTFVQEAETVWNSTASPKTTASISVLTGDILVACLVAEGYLNQTYSVSGGSLVWTPPQQSILVADYTAVQLWTTTATSSTSFAVSGARTAGDNILHYGLNVFTFRNSDGVGASNKTNVASGAPTLNLTTTQANSAIVVASGDWNATDGTSRTWRTGAGTLTEQTYYRDSAKYSLYIGYHADAGAINTYAVGLSAPGSQKYAIAAVEIKGTAGASPTTPQPPGLLRGQAVKRAAFF